MSERHEHSSIVWDTCSAIENAGEIDATIQRLSITLKGCVLTTLAEAQVVLFLRKNHSRVRELTLNNLTGELASIITVALAMCENLESLSIFVKTPTAQGFDCLASSLGVGLITTCSLSKLQLGIGSFSNYFTMTTHAAACLQQGLAENESLCTLIVDNCRFEERSTLRIFAEGLQFNTSLRHVRLASLYEPNGQSVEDHGVACLVRGLENNPQLESLDLSENKCLDEGMIALAALLDRTPLRKLNLGQQHMDRNEFLNTFHLVGALGRTSTLESLELASNHLSTDYDMANLAAALTHNTSVKFLNVKDNSIRSSALSILCSRIPSWRGVETLWIDGSFDDEASENLAMAMRENFVISKIDCDPNLSDFKSIEYYTDLNWGGRRFLQKHSNGAEERISCIPLSLWPTILSRVERLCTNEERRASLIYFYLQKGLAIFPI